MPREMDSELARELQRKGVESRKQRKEELRMGQEVARAILSSPIPADAPAWQPLRSMLEKAGFVVDDLTFEKAMHIVQLVQSLQEGDVKSYQALLKVAGLMEEKHDVNFHEEIIINFGE